MPGSRKDRSNQGRYPCVVCSQQVTVNQKALQCDACDEWTHFKCTPLTCDEYSDLAKSSQDWYCGNCEAHFGGQPSEKSEARRPTAGGDGAGHGAVDGSGELNGDDHDDFLRGQSLNKPSEELLSLLEDDFIKNLGNLVDILKLKFEQIHQMQQKNKQLETENRNLKQQLQDKNEEVQLLQQRLGQQEEPQAEIRRLKSMIRGLRTAVSRDGGGSGPSEAGGGGTNNGRDAGTLVQRQQRMTTVLGRMNNFLAGLSDDLTRTEAFMPVRSPESPPVGAPSLPADIEAQPDDRPRPKKIKRST